MNVVVTVREYQMPLCLFTQVWTSNVCEMSH